MLLRRPTGQRVPLPHRHSFKMDICLIVFTEFNMTIVVVVSVVVFVVVIFLVVVVIVDVVTLFISLFLTNDRRDVK